MRVSRKTKETPAFGGKPSDADIDVYGVTHPGKVRPNNQDHFLIGSLRKQMEIQLTSLPTIETLVGRRERLAFLAMVADGVGGGPKGEEASRLAVERVTQYVSRTMRCYYTADPTDEVAFSRSLMEAAMLSHMDIADEVSRDPSRRGMATTLTLWISTWPRAYLLQVGDSRCYLLRQGELRQISRDQTMAQDLVDQGIMTRTEAYQTRWANVLASAIGGSEAAPVVTRLDPMWNDVGLLCSDGLTKHVPDARIRDRLLSSSSSKQACEALLEDALDAGGTDNITIVVGRTPSDPSAVDF
jgi:serine/threonine protein phosphatase PrpC